VVVADVVRAVVEMEIVDVEADVVDVDETEVVIVWGVSADE
jgi:hypothetical protein